MNKIILSTPEELEGIFKRIFAEELKKFQPVSSNQQTKFLTRKKTAEILNISLVTLNDWAKRGLIKSYTIGGRVLYKESEVEESLNEVKTVKF
jgi:excisionase family DNA binding protein